MVTINKQAPNYPAFKGVHNKLNNPSTLTRGDTVSFSGLQSKDGKAMFVFDLDGTFADGSKETIDNVINMHKERNATLVYATGRTLKEFHILQAKKLTQDITIPTPAYLVTSNGQHIFKNIDGKLIKDPDWEIKINKNTHFDRTKVYETLKELSQTEKYKFSPEQLKKLRSLDDFEKRKQLDPDFWNSKISYYEWSPSEHMVELFVGADVDLEEFEKTLTKELEKKGIKTRYIFNHYSKKIMDKCKESILLQSRPMREDKKGSMNVLFICPANKADSVEYLREKLNIPYNEIVTAGNETNDISLAKLTQKGTFFICVGNASKVFTDFIDTIIDKVANQIVFATKNGAEGIFEGINKIISKINTTNKKG